MRAGVLESVFTQIAGLEVKCKLSESYILSKAVLITSEIDYKTLN